MKAFIPKYGTTIKLTKDWTFKIDPYGGDFVLKIYGARCPKHIDPKEVAFTFPAGTILLFEKISWSKDGWANKVMLKVRETDMLELKFVRGKVKARVEVKLDYINEMEFDVVENNE